MLAFLSYGCMHAGWAARFGSAFFLVIQMIILLDFTQSWNNAWVANGEEDPRWLYGLLGLTVTAFLGVLGIAGGWRAAAVGSLEGFGGVGGGGWRPPQAPQCGGGCRAKC